MMQCNCADVSCIVHTHLWSDKTIVNSSLLSASDIITHISSAIIFSDN